jgi:hypothetical protein
LSGGGEANAEKGCGQQRGKTWNVHCAR